MASTENPLHKYRSYSYHHILIAADTTSVLREMEKKENSSVSLGSLVSKAVRIKGDTVEVNEIPEIGKYVVIMNGMTDCDFYISDLKWETVFCPSYGNTTSTTSIVGLEGTMTVVEPNNIRFMHFLNNVFNALETDPIGVVFILKTIFIGYPEGDDSRPEVYSAVKPLGMTLYDMSSNFEATGSTYTLSFVGISNGAASLSQASSNIMAQIPAIETRVNSYELKEKQIFDTSDPRTQLVFRNVYYSASAETIPLVLGRLQERLNNEYTHFFKNMKGHEKHRRVLYSIDMDDYYLEFENLQIEIPKMDAYRVDAVPTEYATKGKTDGDFNNLAIVFPVGTSIYGAIDLVMRCSSRVLYEANPADPNQKKYTYKILTSIDITNVKIQDGIESAGTYHISFLVKRQPMPEMSAFAALGNPAASRSEQEKLINEHGVLELDYFFTGQNVDILDLKLEMDMALAFLMIYSPANNLNNAPNNEVVQGVTNPQYSKREKSPLFPQRKVTKYDVLQAPKPEQVVGFRTLLNKFSLLSAIETKVKIVGNPLLLNDLINNKAAERPKKKEGVKQEATAPAQSNARPAYVPPGSPKPANTPVPSTPTEKQTTVLRDWTSSPALAKINIKMPIETENPNFDGPVQSEAFWFQGYYYIFSVLNTFSEGSFEQEIELLALPTKDDQIIANNNSTSVSTPVPEVTPPKERAGESIIGKVVEGMEWVSKMFKED